jgi:hypothetical protein
MTFNLLEEENVKMAMETGSNGGKIFVVSVYGTAKLSTGIFDVALATYKAYVDFAKKQRGLKHGLGSEAKMGVN